ncbi:LURP1-like domain-containing protein [Tanacetum coccineum]
MITTPIPIEAQDKTIEEYWNINGTHNGGWNWEELSTFLSHETLKIIASHSVSLRDTQDYRKWEIVWKASVSERIRMSIWLALHDRLLTNSQRVARRLTYDPRCTRCGADEESLDHILRICPLSYMIWNKLSTHPPNSPFWTLPLCEWIMDNLETNKLNNDYKRQMMFAITIWWLWKWSIERSEILALLRGIIMARDVGIRKLIIKLIEQQFDSPPPDLGSIILEDVKGVAT